MKRLTDIKIRTRDIAVYGKMRSLSDPRLLFPAMRNLYAYCRGSEIVSPPVAAAWEITHLCDCSCTFCRTHELGSAEEEPSHEEVERIAEALGEAGVRTVTITGGEPLLSNNLDTALRILRRYGTRVMISTNGGWLYRWADELVRLGVHSVTVSINSLRPEVHDRITGRMGLHDAVERGIHRLAAARLKNRIAVRVRLLITGMNYRELVPLVRKWRKLVDEVCIQPIQQIGGCHVHRVGDERISFKAEMESEFRSQIKKLIMLYPEYDDQYHRQLPDFIFNPSELRNKFYCLIPALGFRISPRGAAMTCAGDGTLLGDLRHDRVSTIWGHPAFGNLRRKSRDRRRDCLCWVQPNRVNFMVPSWLIEMIPTVQR